MAGHMGDARITVQNLDIVRVDAEDGFILVRGAVPGSAGSWVEIRDAVKGAGDADLPMPGAIRKAMEEAAPANEEPASAEAEMTAEGAPAEGAAGDEESQS